MRKITDSYMDKYSATLSASLNSMLNDSHQQYRIYSLKSQAYLRDWAISQLQSTRPESLSTIFRLSPGNQRNWFTTIPGYKNVDWLQEQFNLETIICWPSFISPFDCLLEALSESSIHSTPPRFPETCHSTEGFLQSLHRFRLAAEKLALVPSLFPAIQFL